MKKRISVFTLGCRVNHFESDAIADAAEAAGWEIAKWGDIADAAIINSCALTDTAVLKTRRAIAFFSKRNPLSPVCVTGCCAQIHADALLKIPSVKWIIGNAHKADCLKIMEENPPSEKAALFSAKIQEIREIGALARCGRSPISDRTNLKIQDGCDNFCSYCVIPLARGLPRSREISDIVEDAKNIVSRGAREIVLTGINIAKFSPQSGGNLIGLIDELNSVRGLLRLRIGSIEPPKFPLEELLVRAADKSHKLMPHLHISAQSLSDKILEIMRRRYRADEFLNAVKSAREKVPDIFLGCDIICGHPGEGEEDYLLTRERALSSPLSNMHVFTFSPRPGTLAEKTDCLPPAPVRKARADDLRKAAESLYKNFLKTQAGKIRTALLENRLPDASYMAYTDNYIQLKIGGLPPGMKNQLVRVKLEGEALKASLV